MAFSYPPYNSEADGEAHTRSFLNVWNANHVSQRLPKTEGNASKIAELEHCLQERPKSTTTATSATPELKKLHEEVKAQTTIVAKAKREIEITEMEIERLRFEL